MPEVTEEIIVGLFPGQGAYRPGALSELWRDDHRVVREVFGAIDLVADERATRRVSSLVFGDNPPSLTEMLSQHPDELQLAIFGNSVVAHRLLQEQGGRLSVLVGHSLGEIAALVSAGVWSVRDGASIVCDRNAALRAHAPADGRMLVLGCGAERAQVLVDLVGSADLALAVDNGPAQTVLSGPATTVAVARGVAEALGVTATTVASAYGFHHRALATAGRELARKAAAYRQGPLKAEVYSPVLGRSYRDADDLAGLLGTHLIHPVGFRGAVAGLWARGARIFVELGAGGALIGQVRNAFPLAVGLRGLTDSPEGAAEAAAFIGATPARAATEVLPVEVGPVTVPAAAEVRRAEPAPVAPAVVTPELERPEVLGQLREMYAEALEYPVEVLEEDALLEADLGVDSIRQTELLTRTRHVFGLGEAAADFRGADYDTLGKITDYVLTDSGRASEPVKAGR